MSSSTDSLPLSLLAFFGTVAIGRTILQKRNNNTSSKSFTSSILSSKQSSSSSSSSSSPKPCNISPAQTLNLLQNRRSIFTKQFTGKAVPKHVIEDMLEGARWAPTHKLTEPWHFIVFESDTAKKELGEFMGNLYKQRCAPVVVDNDITENTTNNNNNNIKNNDNSSNNNDDDVNKNKFKRPFQQGKYKKLTQILPKQASHIIAICVQIPPANQSKCNPFVEEVCSVAMAVQNMHLMATSHGVGAYWSSALVYQPPQEKEESEGTNTTTTTLGVVNPVELSNYLGLTVSSNDMDGSDNEQTTTTPTTTVTAICLGWFIVGDYYGEDAMVSSKQWPTGRRSDMNDKIVWR